MTFQELGLNEPILRALADQGYEQPSPIQAKAIPPALTGRDVLGCAQTGTGKTCAFAAPILQQLSGRKAQGRPIRALILTPTRELALQIQESFEAYGKYLPLRSTVIFGGVGQAPQVERLKNGVDILVATPGRLGDLYGQKLIDLSRLEIFVLDEADRMLDMGFIHDVCGIPLAARKSRPSFSPPPCPPRCRGWWLLHNPAKVAVNPISPGGGIDQSSTTWKGNKKAARRPHPGAGRENALVFTRTKHGANKVAGDLVKAGISAAAIHGNKSQTARQQALADFKGGAVQVLVATDIAARGLDIEELSHVFNYNLPDVPETYVHRIGRTGRAGRGGTAISFCDINEKDELKAIEKLIGRAIPVVEGHPWPMEVLEPLPRDKKGRMVNPEDAEARAAAKERRRQRDAANKAAAEARKAKANQKVLEQPPQPEPAGETSAKKRRKRGQRNSATLEEALTATAPARPVQAEFADFHKPDPLASDVIMDATARLLAPRGRAQAAPKKDKPLNSPLKSGKAPRPPEPLRAEPQAAEAQAADATAAGAVPGGHPAHQWQKDSTEQPSLMKPYYLSHD
ncbi:MAG: DEAD/DEAH box helicase [Flavonifractor plautii]